LALVTRLNHWFHQGHRLRHAIAHHISLITYHCQDPRQGTDLSLSPFPGEGNKKNDTSQEKNNTADQPQDAPGSYTISNKKEATHQKEHPAKDLKMPFFFLIPCGH